MKTNESLGLKEFPRGDWRCKKKEQNGEGCPSLPRINIAIVDEGFVSCSVLCG
jgi:hypothetical protein